VEEKISPETKAIIVAHLFGQPAVCIKNILRIAKQRGLSVIEDGAQSFGASIKYNNKLESVGTIGDIGCLSFSSTKLFAAPGKGGAVVVRDQQLRDKIACMRNYGAKVPYYDYPVVGINMRLDEIQAAALLAKQPFFEYWLLYRQKLAMRYTEALSGLGNILLPKEIKNTERVWYRYVIRTKNREQLFKYLQDIFYSTPHLRPRIYYPVSLPSFSIFKSGDNREKFSVAEQMSTEVLSLPLNEFMSLKDVDIVCGAVGSFFKK